MRFLECKDEAGNRYHVPVNQITMILGDSGKVIVAGMWELWPLEEMPLVELMKYISDEEEEGEDD